MAVACIIKKCSIKNKWYLNQSNQISCHRSGACASPTRILGPGILHRAAILIQLEILEGTCNHQTLALRRNNKHLRRTSSLETNLLASGLLKHAAQLVGDLLVLRSVLAGVHGVAGL